MPESPITPLNRRLMLAASGLVFVIALIQILQTSSRQWQPRPDIACEQGLAVHQTAQINANRVNIRDLPTVFSTVLTQANTGDPVTVVCVFGAWSQIATTATDPVQWVSSGLITPEEAQPLPVQTQLSLLLMAIVSALWLLLSAIRPTWIPSAAQWVFKTDELPPHAQPLIKKSEVAVPADQQLRKQRI